LIAFLLGSVTSPAGAQAVCPTPRLPAYAHNDYDNPDPLTDALTLGYRGVEADVFLVDGVLRLGHDRRSARTGAPFETRYLMPLDSVLARCAPMRADGARFLLAVELKESSRVAYDSLVRSLARYPAVVAATDVVLVGWHPEPATLDAASMPLQHQYRLRTPDAMSGDTLDAGVRLLSLDYGKTMGRWWVRASGRQRWLAALRAVKTAHPTHLLRVHNVPADSAVYRALLEAGVDLIGTKTLPASARLLERFTAP
jgi:glycerophosphoryl diester phosphodiesterase